MPAKLWTIPEIWDGDPVYIIGGGPSLTGFDARSLEGRKVIAVNCAFRLGQFDVMFYGDPDWPKRYGKGLDQFGGLKVTTREEHLGQDVRVVKREPYAVGLSRRPDRLHWNLSSGACAINLATLLGAGKIILLGFDMKKRGSQDNYHDDYRHPDGTHAPVGDYEKMRARFPMIADDLKVMKIPCINGCPDSAIDCFPRRTIEEAIS